MLKSLPVVSLFTFHKPKGILYQEKKLIYEDDLEVTISIVQTQFPERLADYVDKRHVRKLIM